VPSSVSIVLSAFPPWRGGTPGLTTFLYAGPYLSPKVCFSPSRTPLYLTVPSFVTLLLMTPSVIFFLAWRTNRLPPTEQPPTDIFEPLAEILSNFPTHIFSVFFLFISKHILFTTNALFSLIRDSYSLDRRPTLPLLPTILRPYHSPVHVTWFEAALRRGRYRSGIETPPVLMTYLSFLGTIHLLRVMVGPHVLIIHSPYRPPVLPPSKVHFRPVSVFLSGRWPSWDPIPLSTGNCSIVPISLPLLFC